MAPLFGALHQIAPNASLAKVMLPWMVGCAGYWVWYRTVYGWGRTMNQEWYNAEEQYMEAMPRQGSPTPIRINPFSDKINMHLTR
ncbi:hypothetical protein ABPG75_006243 [Micractinium tetrahymenae]